MKQIVCEMCGSNDLIKQDGAFVCQHCGMKYTVEEVRKMMIEGTVDVKGTVKVDNSQFVQRYLQNAQRALNKEDWEEVEKYYNMVEQNVPNNIESVFFSAYAKAIISLREADYYKRSDKFKVLNKSISIISDHYETTNENKEELLNKIVLYIDKLFEVQYIYQKDTNPSLFSTTHLNVGGYTWCQNLLNETRNTYIKELKEIYAKHNESFVKKIIDNYEMKANQETENKPNPGPAIFIFTFIFVVVMLIIVFSNM